MKNATTTLPDNPVTLKEMLALEREENGFLREQIRLLKARLYGRKSEKDLALGDQEQMALFALEHEPAPDEPEADDEGSNPEKNKKKKGRKPLPDHFPRVEVFHDIPEEEKLCDCGCQKKQFDVEVSEQLEIKPAEPLVMRHIRPLYACPACEGVDSEGQTVSIAPPPVQLIPKSLATPSLLAYLFAGKFADGLPFYRQESILERMDVSLSRATMASWAIRMAEKCTVLVDHLWAELKQSNYIQADETSIQVMNESGRANTTKSFMWVVRGAPPGRRITIFQYHPTRSSDFLQHYLEGYQGYFQSDGYKAYDFLDKWPGVTLLACMAHARRKFADICKAAGKKGKKGLAGQAVRYFKALYKTEKKARLQNLNDAEIKQLREVESAPVLEEFKKWLDAHAPKVPPTSLLGQAIQYTRNLWPRLIRYLEEGFLQIDNNQNENEIRPFVVGRKNWLHCATPKGAQANAVFYTLISTAKANGWEPYAYLRFLFEGLLAPEDDIDYEVLLPLNPPSGANLSVHAPSWGKQ